MNSDQLHVQTVNLLNQYDVHTIGNKGRHVLPPINYESKASTKQQINNKDDSEELDDLINELKAVEQSPKSKGKNQSPYKGTNL